MDPRITFQPMAVLTDTEDREGCLVLANDKLVAVLVHLSDPAHEWPLLGSWYLEAGFGAALDMRHDLFASLDEAAEMICTELTEHRVKRPF